MYWDGDSLDRIGRYGLILDVQMTIEIMSWQIHWHCIQYKHEILGWLYIWNCIMIRGARLLLYEFMLLKATGKWLLDRNTLYSPIIHRIHGYYYRSLVLIFFTVYTITDLLLLYCYCYCHCIVPVIEITWILIVLNNNIIDNLHKDWGNWWRRQRLYFGWT